MVFRVFASNKLFGIEFRNLLTLEIKGMFGKEKKGGVWEREITYRGSRFFTRYRVREDSSNFISPGISLPFVTGGGDKTLERHSKGRGEELQKWEWQGRNYGMIGGDFDWNGGKRRFFSLLSLAAGVEGEESEK